MTNAYHHNTIEEPRAKALLASVADEAAEPIITRETDQALRSHTSSGKVKTSTGQPFREAEQIRKRLNGFYLASRAEASSQHVSQLVEQITQMTQRTLNASASTVLLLENDGHDLLFEVADGQVGKQLRRARISAQFGIAGWVSRHGEPLVVNDVNKDQRFNKIVDTITGFTTKSIICCPLIVQRKVIGVIEALNKLDGSNFNDHDLETLMSAASTAATAINNVRLHQTILDSYMTTIRVLSVAIDAKDPYACGHSQRVSDYAVLQANSMSLSRDERKVIEYAAILHDIGKIYIPESILAKPGPLTSEEWRIMNKHPVIGSDMLKQIPFLEKASELVLHHHERYDGSGYPDGLKGKDIPIGARLIAVADAFDTMTTYHAYRVAFTIDHAIERLRKFSRIQFCPIAVQAFVSGFSKFHYI